MQKYLLSAFIIAIFILPIVSYAHGIEHTGNDVTNNQKITTGTQLQEMEHSITSLGHILESDNYQGVHEQTSQISLETDQVLNSLDVDPAKSSRLRAAGGQLKQQLDTLHVVADKNNKERVAISLKKVKAAFLIFKTLTEMDNNR